MHGSHLRRGSPRGGVAPIIATILLVGMTVAAGVLVWSFTLRPTQPAPQVFFQATGGQTYPVWGDPTDCTPVLPNPTSYYTTGGTSNPNWDTYKTAWVSQCETSTTGMYNLMNVSMISITKVTEPIPLTAVWFDFVCTNNTPVRVTTHLVQGSLAAMSWYPGSSQSIPSNAPTLGACATFVATGSGQFSTYYNRLGFYEPLSSSATYLEAGDAFILYLHTSNSVFEAPSPAEPASTWNHPDVDDYHGAPPWCFTVVGACTIYLTDTQTTPQVVLASIPVSSLA